MVGMSSRLVRFTPVARNTPKPAIGVNHESACLCFGLAGWHAQNGRCNTRHRARRIVPKATSLVVGRARAYLAAIPKPVIGQGSDAVTFYAACRLVRGFDLSAADAEALLWDWAGGRAGWTREWIAEKVDNAQYGTEPIGVLR
jgi:hypothetical protein